MAETFSIMCDDCRVMLGIAQDHAANSLAFFIYCGGDQAFPREGQEDRWSPLAEFLFMHQRHTLRFTSLNDETDAEGEYLILDGRTPGLPPEPDDEQASWLGAEELERMKTHYAANAGYIADPEVRRLARQRS